MSRTGIAGTLKMKRKELGLSIDTVCKQLEKYDISLSKNSMYNYESGYRQPDADTLMALCEIYNIEDILATFGYKKFHGTTESISEKKTINQGRLSPTLLEQDEQQLINDYRSLNSQGQSLVRQNMELIVLSDKYKKYYDLPDMEKEA